MKNTERYVWAALRIGMGWIFLWPFLDKLFGLGFTTAPEDAWLAGGSPTFGYLKFGTAGPLAPFFQSLAGNPVVDWLFMGGLLLIGLALMLGIGIKIAGYAGALMMFLMWLSHLPPERNPILDEHIVYLVVLTGLARLGAGQWVGLGKWWAKRVKGYAFLA
jgi:thiosulfate dehydrogenase [quinone] large subunit